MKYKNVMTWDSGQKKFRVFRFLWQRGIVGDGFGYSAKLSFSIVAKLFSFTRGMFGWRLTVLGLQIHHLKAFGGIIP